MQTVAGGSVSNPQKAATAAVPPQYFHGLLPEVLFFCPAVGPVNIGDQCDQFIFHGLPQGIFVNGCKIVAVKFFPDTWSHIGTAGSRLILVTY
nr:hypothetical protein [Desulfobulbaceae bacterium]